MSKERDERERKRLAEMARTMGGVLDFSSGRSITDPRTFDEREDAARAYDAKQEEAARELARTFGFTPPGTILSPTVRSKADMRSKELDNLSGLLSAARAKAQGIEVAPPAPAMNPARAAQHGLAPAPAMNPARAAQHGLAPAPVQNPTAYGAPQRANQNLGFLNEDALETAQTPAQQLSLGQYGTFSATPPDPSPNPNRTELAGLNAELEGLHAAQTMASTFSAPAPMATAPMASLDDAGMPDVGLSAPTAAAPAPSLSAGLMSGAPASASAAPAPSISAALMSGAPASRLGGFTNPAMGPIAQSLGPLANQRAAAVQDLNDVREALGLVQQNMGLLQSMDMNELENNARAAMGAVHGRIGSFAQPALASAFDGLNNAFDGSTAAPVTDIDGSALDGYGVSVSLGDDDAFGDDGLESDMGVGVGLGMSAADDGGFGDDGLASDTGVGMGGADADVADIGGAASAGGDDGAFGDDGLESDTGDAGGGECVIATHALQHGAFSRRDRARAVTWCKRALHGHWAGETIRRGYRHLASRKVDQGRAHEHYGEFQRYIETATGKRTRVRDRLHFAARTVQFFVVGLMV